MAATDLNANPKSQTSTWTRRLLRILGTAMFGLIVALVALWFMTGSSDRVIKQWRQPKELDYRSFDPYTLSVVEGQIDWRIMGFPRRHYIFIGSGSDAPSYGHYLDYRFYPGYDDIEVHIGRSTVDWTPEGLTFVEATGHLACSFRKTCTLAAVEPHRRQEERAGIVSREAS